MKVTTKFARPLRVLFAGIAALILAVGFSACGDTANASDDSNSTSESASSCQAGS